MKPLDVEALKAGLRKLHERLTEDLVERADQRRVERALRATFEKTTKDRRTGEDFTLWRRHFAAQVASAWILSTLFVRVLEDRGFLPRRRLAGEGDAGRTAHEGRDTLGELAPHLGARELLLLVFQELMTFEAVAPLFDPAHNLAWRLTPSDTVARELIAFWETPDPDDAERLRFAFDRERAPTTRFLGDVYEELDPDAKKRFALLQTPDFIERFILDRTLTPALGAFGLGTPEDPFRLIDPTCGSGHFLLGAFHRLVREWEKAAPAVGPREWTTRALRSVAGVDLNPYATAIARFRLVLAAFEEAGVTSLVGAPTFMPNVTTADALFGGLDAPTSGNSIQTEFGGGTWTGSALFEFEDPVEVQKVLGQRYHVVVGNPPYDAIEDAALIESYRGRYRSWSGASVPLGVPFSERFFGLATAGGFVGFINSNNFMTRDSGVKLIEDVLAKVEIEAIYDTSAVPWCAVGTVIIVGRRQKPSLSSVRVAVCLRGEDQRGGSPAQGRVWRTLLERGNDDGFQDEVLAVLSVDREIVDKHPWSFLDSRASATLSALERHRLCLKEVTTAIGAACMTRANGVYFAPRGSLERQRIPKSHVVPNVGGDKVCDWHIDTPDAALFPYGADLAPLAEKELGQVLRFLWPFRTHLWLRREPNGNHRELGLTWWEWSRFQRSRFKSRFFLAYHEIATHNLFVMGRGAQGYAFNQTAPVVIPKAEYSDESEVLKLLAVMNSSTMSFWMRCRGKPKGAQGVGRGTTTEQWERFYAFGGRRLGKAPLPKLEDLDALVPYARELDRLGNHYGAALLAGQDVFALATAGRLDGAIEIAIRERTSLLSRMCGLQEELDWLVYELYGLIPAGAGRVVRAEDAPALALGHRSFEVVLAREAAGGRVRTSWFGRHGATMSTELPTDYDRPGLSYSGVMRHRIALIASDSKLQVLERPEHKRRWNVDAVQGRARKELREALLERIEAHVATGVEPISLRRLCSGLERDKAFRQVAALFAGDPGVQLEATVRDLLGQEAVPEFRASYLSELGLVRLASWQEHWAAQRREDTGEPTVMVAPEVFSKPDYLGRTWQQRGEFNVPTERFISYPGCASSNDPTDVFGWAGWDYLQRARALTALYESRKTEDGWDRERLLPLLTGVQELIPWLLQWHNEPSEEYGGERPGETFRAWLEAELAALVVSPQDLAAWRPPKRKAGRRATAKVAPKKARPAEEDDEEVEGTSDAGASPPDDPPTPPRRPRAPASSVDPDRVLAAVKERGGQATLAELVEALEAPQKAVRAAADALVEAGRLVQTKQRPITYQVTGAAP